MDVYGFAAEMRPATSCPWPTIEYAERATPALGAPPKVITDCFFLHRRDLVPQLNIKTPSTNYAAWAREFGQIAATAGLVRFA